MDKKLSFVGLLCYDYEYLLRSIRSYYDIADEIIIGLDKDMKTWSGNKFEIPQSFYDTLNEIDVKSKITIVKSNFFVSSNPMQNDTYERNYLTRYCMEDSWIIQIDSDEVILEPEKLKEEIISIEDYDCELNILWKNVFKVFDSGNLVIVPENERATIGTMRRGSYVCCRGTNQRKRLLGGYLLHNSFGRSENELHQKLTNWSHTNDFDVEKYFSFWKGINLDNYKEIKNFHPINPETWQELKFVSNHG